MQLNMQSVLSVSGVVFLLLVVLNGGLVECSLSQLDNRNFTKAVVSSDKIWVVAFYSPRCSACLQFVQEWQKLVEGSYVGLEFGLVNIDEKEGFALAADMGIFEEGLPNVKVFPYEFDSTGIAVWNGVELKHGLPGEQQPQL
eukprot:TRINITY_DN12390_c0_g1_i1.p2 TRINITY_DN12390_c0_g1~~TRINITY_DN12390_c0_g1_i1.p2  ORF type:complete len:142 (+),score=13.93 TRINITY_DN12390_c0_g1_i1:194-619(+)